MFKNILSFAGWFLLLSVMLIGCFLLAAWQGWPLYTALMCWLILLSVTILMRLAWVALIPWVTRGKLKQLFPSVRYSRFEQVLFEHWKSGAGVIKRIGSRNKRVPWFVMLGERCGKTTLMASAGLPLFSHQPENHVVVPTRTLRWWFFKTACFLDSSSYFLQSKPAARQGWQRLTRWCGRLPAPSGAVITLSCRDLHSRTALELHQQARAVRAQLETLMKSVNRQLPLYVVLTQCDQIAGFTLWSSKLSTAQRHQALGYLWRKAPIADRRDPTLLDPLFSALRRGTGLSRLGMFSEALSAAETDMLLDLPAQLDALQPPLHHYIAALSEPDAYFSTGTLGGIWLTACPEQTAHDQPREALFVQNLILSRLPEISRAHKPQAFGRVQQWFNLRGKALLTAVAAGALLFSAWQTAALISTADSQEPEVLTARLARNESRGDRPLRYLPFTPLLNHRHAQLERALFDTAGVRLQSPESVMESYRASFYAASPPQQRQIILQLAETILTYKAMAQGERLSVLATRPSLPPIFTASGATPRVELAMTRARVRLGGDGGGITTLQQTLREFVSSDLQWRWLVAEDATLGGLQIAHFWPQSATKSQLSGIWLSAGSDKIAAQLSLLEQAMDGDSVSLPALAEFRQRWPEKQQEAWLAFLVLLAKEEPLSAGTLASSAQLMALIQGNDPASAFIRLLVTELAAVPAHQAQPWLTEARRLHHLQQLPGSVSMIDLWDDREKNLRRGLRAWLTGQPVDVFKKNGDTQAWDDWRKALHDTANQMMVTGTESPQLTAGLFGEPRTEGPNPLTKLYAQYVQLRGQLEHPGNNIGRGAVWALLESQMRLLTGHAMATSACWLEQKWHSSVLSPLAHRAEFRDPAAQQEALWRYLTDFVREAQPVLNITSSGLHAGEFEGYRIPFAPPFLNLINHVIDPDALRVMPERAQTLAHDALALIDEKRTALETERAALIKKIVDVQVTSLPATIPGGARLMPVGTQLALHCEDKTWRLDSHNLLAEAEFRSAPAQCSAVNLTIQFPGFDVTHHYLGDNAWNDFLTDFDSDERRFTPDEFSREARSMLESTGIREILVRYRLQGQQEVFRQTQRWQSLNEEIAALDLSRDEHLQQQRERQQPRDLVGKLAELPTSIAVCRQ